MYSTVLEELRSGEKRSHWMWFIFPQIAGLGSSAMARKYAVADLHEATAYLSHPQLGARLEECTQLVAAISGVSLDQILGWPDNLKFHSSMTLFSRVSHHGEIIDVALEKYFDGAPDEPTLALLSGR
ncbi:MAG: hypothetical protein JWL72_2201 [Ilumatobacteraceae bacterium]|nr:hypothetical protein [Ilumatobacteraceae bacterium]